MLFNGKLTGPAKWISKWRGYGKPKVLPTAMVRWQEKLLNSRCSRMVKTVHFGLGESLLIASVLKPFLFFFCFPFFCLLRKKTGRGTCPPAHPRGAVHQESMLSLLFFFIVRRTSPESFRSCYLCLILYTYNLLISAKFIKELEQKSIWSRDLV